MSELDEVFDLVYQRTMDGKINWKFEDNRNYASVVQGSNLIELSIFEDHATISVRNKNGQVISFAVYERGEARHEMSMGLLDHIKRQHFGVDQALNDIKQRLKAL